MSDVSDETGLETSIDNPEHDPGIRPKHRPGSFLDRRDRRGMRQAPHIDPIATTTGATCLGNTSEAT